MGWCARLVDYEGREERSRFNVDRIICLGHRCIPHLEINGLPAVSVGPPAMLHELEDHVETFFEFDVTIGLCVADAYVWRGVDPSRAGRRWDDVAA